MILLRRTDVARAVLLISALNGLVFVASNPLRLAFIAETFVPFLLGGYASMALATLGLYLWLSSSRLTSIESLVVAYLTILLAAGLWNGTPASLVFVDFARPVLFFSTVAFLRSSLPPPRQLVGWVTLVGWATVVLSLAILLLCWVLRLFEVPLYPAYMTLDAAMGLGVLWGNGTALVIYVLASVASGKRGLYIAMALMLTVWCVRRWGFRALVLLAIAAAIALAGAMAIPEVRAIVFSFLFKSQDLAGWGGPLLRMLLAGRMEEFEGAFKGMYGPLDILFGRGLGFTYSIEGIETATNAYRNLHFTPAALLVYYGGVFVVLIAAYLVPLIRFALTLLVQRRGIVETTYAAYFLVGLVYSLTEYSIFAYSNFAVATGVLMSIGTSSRKRLQEGTETA